MGCVITYNWHKELPPSCNFGSYRRFYIDFGLLLITFQNPFVKFVQMTILPFFLFLRYVIFPSCSKKINPFAIFMVSVQKERQNGDYYYYQLNFLNFAHFLCIWGFLLPFFFPFPSKYRQRYFFIYHNLMQGK